MNKTFLIFILTIVSLTQLTAQMESPYFNLCSFEGSVESAATKVKNALHEKSFKVIGEYSVGGNENLYVICYTRNDLEEIALSFADRGSLAATLKVGVKKNGNSVTVSMINPMYLFYAYFIDGIEEHENTLKEISDQAINAIKSVGNSLEAFGGELEKKKLQKYHYKVMMPYFKDAEKLNTFSSFEEGLKTTQGNLSEELGQTKKVYELVYADKEVAVFGVALLNEKDGESHFLPIIGEDHLAAMPYEIILQGNEATILPGRYRIALHWPELTMGTFMKIMSTPGDIKKTLKGLTE
ncbi:MAG: hypothetical protein HQ541_22665 [Mariniphaga sp.]|nr:hypothetical protein [Mariniphaga sp.]